MGCNLCPSSGQIDSFEVLQRRPRNNREQSQMPSLSVFSSRQSSSSISIAINPERQPSQQVVEQQLGGEPQAIDINSLFEIYLNVRESGHQNPALQTQDIFVGFVNFLRMATSVQPREGLTSRQIDQIPIIVAPNSEGTCPICSDSIAKGQRLLGLKCRHLFHRDCLSQWLIRSNKCPMCRQQVIQRQN